MTSQQIRASGPIEADIAIVGAGIAGASAAAFAAASARIVVLEREAQPGYHTTGRSAALFTETYGPRLMRALTVASRPFFEAPPEGFAAAPLLTPRGVLMVAREDQRAEAEALARQSEAEGVASRLLDGAGARALCPVLDPEAIVAGLHEPDAMDIDVHGLHQGFLRQLRARGGRVLTDAEVIGLERSGGTWRIATRAGEVRAPVLVDAAGAWADELAMLAGAAPVGLVPKRRTALTVDAPEGIDAADWPMVAGIGHDFYFKPESGRLLVSPADETPSPPCDAQPDEMDVALAVDRVERATTMRIDRIRHRWAGLRSFVADGDLVLGWDESVEGFFWCAGQGGYGIQTAPAAGAAAAALLRGEALPPHLAERGIIESMLSPHRLRRAVVAAGGSP